MTQLAIAELLAQSRLFGSLGAAERATVAAQMRPASYGAGQVIFARGDAGRDVYLVTEGRVRLSVLTLEGRELSFWHAEPGSIFGEIAALDGGARTADATAVTAVKVMTLGQPALRRLIADMPLLAQAMLEMLCHRLREADQQLEAIALHPIEVRLARFLLTALRQKHPERRTGEAVIDLGMSQGELALLIGASRPKVNAALVALEDSGAIGRDGARLTCDLDALMEVAGID